MEIATNAGSQRHPVRRSLPSDSETILKTKKTVSYEQLIAPVEAQMMRSIWRIVRHPEAAEDTLQDALFIIWKKRDRIFLHPNPQALILKICVNAAYDTLRKSKRIRQREGYTDIQDLPAESQDDGFHQLQKKSVEAEILGTIRRLPKKQASAVLLRIVLDQSYNSIAQVLGCSEVTARIHVSKGRKKLSQRLSHLDPTSTRENKDE